MCCASSEELNYEAPAFPSSIELVPSMSGIEPENVYHLKSIATDVREVLYRLISVVVWSVFRLRRPCPERLLQH